MNADEFMLPEGTQKFYEDGIEKNRLSEKWGRLEKTRVEHILNKFLPKTPATILDVGGGMGIYAYPLAKKGHSVYLIDPVPINIEEAKKIGKNCPLKDYIIGDARKLPFEDNSVDVVLFFGPLYHLDVKNRQIALLEAYRVLKPEGLLLAQGISKFCLLFNAFFDGKAKNPQIIESIKNCLETGQFEYNKGLFFTHTPEELKEEIGKAGFQQVNVMSVESLGKWLNIEYWEIEELRQNLLSFIEKTENETSIIGISAHIMAIGNKFPEK